MPSILKRLQHGWNAFTGRDPTTWRDLGPGSSRRLDRSRIFINSDRSIIATVQNRIALDVAQMNIEHVRVDENGNYLETIKSGLNNALTLDANIDQTGRCLIQDAVQSMFEEGVVAIVPVETDLNPNVTGAYDVVELRCGKIVQWFPEYIIASVYNKRSGRREEIALPKATTAIIENPFYTIMNEPNSIAQRLLATLDDLDIANQNTSSGKMDLIVQLPYTIKSDARRELAEKRVKNIEMQLSGSKYGIAYADATEKITQLNRSVENNLWTQVKELMNMLFNQLGLTQSIFDGTATSEELLNYYNRTIEPILTALTEEMKRKFLTKTARTKGQTIKYFRDPFRLVSVTDLAAIADSFTANEIMTSNEVRAIIGYKPVDTQRANELINKNINTIGEEGETLDGEVGEMPDLGQERDEVDDRIDSLLAKIKGVS